MGSQARCLCHQETSDGQHTLPADRGLLPRDGCLNFVDLRSGALDGRLCVVRGSSHGEAGRGCAMTGRTCALHRPLRTMHQPLYSAAGPLGGMNESLTGMITAKCMMKPGGLGGMGGSTIRAPSACAAGASGRLAGSSRSRREIRFRTRIRLMFIEATDSGLAKAKILFALARTASNAARDAATQAETFESYRRKAEILSRLILECSEHVVIDFDHGSGDTVSVRLVDTEPRSGLHVPLGHLDPQALGAVSLQIAA